MKHKKLLASVASAALLGTAMFPTSVFAADDYGIVYKGGKPFAENNGTININSQLVEGLSTLVLGGAGEVTVGENWSEGWHNRHGNDTECYAIKYFTINDAATKHSFSIKNNNYQIDVDVTNVSVVDPPAKPIAVGIDTGNGFLYGSNVIYETKEKCQGKKSEDRITGTISRESATNRQFIETNIKLKKVGADSPYLAGDNNLYFGLTDVDVSQSYKVLNSGNELSQSNMFAKDAKLLQQDFYYTKEGSEIVPKENPGTLPTNCEANGPTATTPVAGKFLNCFKDGYIYSEYNTSSNTAALNADLLGSDVFVALKDQTQREGLKLVFGFAGPAGSGIEYYAKQYTVTYTSDENGVIPEGARLLENLVAGDVASGSEDEPKEGYEFSHWIADTDVTLTDGKTIKAGDPITPEEVKKVVVDKDITFTAINEEEGGGEPEDDDNDDEEGGVIAVPDTGTSTKNLSAVLIPASAITILLSALFIRFLPRLMHKKVSFKK